MDSKDSSNGLKKQKKKQIKSRDNLKIIVEKKAGRDFHMPEEKF